MKRILSSALVALLLLAANPAPAGAVITSYDVSNLPVMFTDTAITVGQTTGIQLQAPERNRVTLTYPTTSGGILRIYQGWKEEFIHYSSASVNSTTKVVTLSGVSRNLCISQFTNIISCGSGYSFGRGAYAELSTASWLLNKKANIDRVNVFTGSGQITGTMTGQALIRLNSVTTAQRDAFTYGPNNGDLIRNSTLGCPQFYEGGVWYCLPTTNSGVVVNATTTSRGVGEVATVSDLSGATLTDSGAPLWISTTVVQRSSTGAINNRNKVVATDNTGYLSSTLLPNIPVTKLNSGTNASSTTFWRGDGTWAGAGITTMVASGSYATKLTSNSGQQNFSRNYTFSANALSTGDLYEYLLTGTGAGVGARFLYRVKLGSTEICRSQDLAINRPWFTIYGTFSVQSTGASGKVHSVCNATMGTNLSTATGSLATIDTTATQTFQGSVQNDVTQAGSYSYLTSIYLRKLFP